MKTIRPSWLLLNLFLALSVSAGPTILYVSESGVNRISIYKMDEASGDLTRTGAVELPAAPGALAISADRRHVYAAIRSNQFATFSTDPKTGMLGKPVLTPAGINGSYLHVDHTGKWLLAAGYSEGRVTVSALTKGAITGAPVVTLEVGKKAHCILTHPANRFALVSHVGEVNRVDQLRFDTSTGALTPNTPPAMDGGAGQGPRHMKFHPNGRWLYLVNEQGQSVSRCDYDARTGILKLRETVSTTPPDWDKAKGSCADIHVSSDGRFVYASNRGHDSLAVFSVDADTGKLKALGQTPTEKIPRSFCLVPGGEKFVVAGGHSANRLIVFQRNAGTGALTPLKTYDCGKGPGWVMGVKF